MNETVNSWWSVSDSTAWLLALLMVGVGVAGGIVITAWQNRRLRRLTVAAQSGLAEQFGSIQLAVPGVRCDILAGSKFVHFFDPEDETVFASVALRDVTHLKIFEQTRDSIRFALRLRSGIDTLPVETFSPASFTNLFHHLTRLGKQVVYVPR